MQIVTLERVPPSPALFACRRLLNLATCARLASASDMKTVVNVMVIISSSISSIISSISSIMTDGINIVTMTTVTSTVPVQAAWSTPEANGC